MSKSIFKNSISLSFLFLFLLVRVVNLHAFEHLNSDVATEDCELCEVMMNENKLSSFLPSESLDISFTHFEVTCDQLNSFYTNPLETVNCPLNIHNKPPPFPSEK